MSVDPSSRRPNLNIHQVSSSSELAESKKEKSVKLTFFNPKNAQGAKLSGRATHQKSNRTTATARSRFAMKRLEGRVSRNPGTVVSINKRFSESVSNNGTGRSLSHAQTLQESPRAANIRRRMAS